jgi:hypothetical protein
MTPLVAVPIVLMSLAYGPPPPQVVQLQRSCDTFAGSITKVVVHAATAQPGVIAASVSVVVPGMLTGRVAFNPSGSTIGVARDASGGEGGGYGCATGAVGPGVPKGHGRSRVVSRLSRTFTQPGTYTVTFELNATGRRILARLGARQRIYRNRHPHGSRPPSIAFGVGLSYTPSG